MTNPAVHKAPGSPPHLRPARVTLSQLEIEVVRKEFNAEHYLRQGARPGTLDPVVDYCMVGWRNGLEPAPWFSTSYYLRNYPDVAASGKNPFFHYLLFGRKEGRAPSIDHDRFERSVIAAIGRNLDVDFYRSQLSRDERGNVDVVLHFVSVGWKSGLRPAPWFDCNFYLATYADVREAGVNPFFHYITAGRSEGRAANAEELHRPDEREEHRDFADRESAGARSGNESQATSPLSVAAVSEAEMRTMAAAFDPVYYANKYPDVASAGVDPLLHYATRGWREGRKPIYWFDTQYYLDVYPDVRDWGGNPFLHYLSAGEAEGRRTTPPSPLRTILLAGALNATEKGNSGSDYDFPALDIKALAKAINKTRTQAELVISVSHDCYLTSVGGIQAFLRQEKARFEKLGVIYLNVFPMRPMLGIRDSAKDYRVAVCLGGKVVGAIHFARLGALVSGMVRKRKVVVGGLLVHSMAGHSPEVVGSLAKRWKTRRTIFWVHDYSAICVNHNLLRNDIEFCGPPPAQSHACRICRHWKARASSSVRYKAFLSETSATIAAPSEAAATIWAAAMPEFPAPVVLPHREVLLAREQKAHLKRPHSGKELRIAYCGHPVHHKGWHLFSELADRLLGNGRVRLFHLGTQDTRTPGVCFVEANTFKNRNAMKNALLKEQIDCVFLGSIWPETFCYVLYEVLGAGVPVLVFAESGNVAREVAQHGWGLQINTDMEALAEAVVQPAFRKRLDLARRRAGRIKSVRDVGTSAALWSKR